jgi:hypothetical protein
MELQTLFGRESAARTFLKEHSTAHISIPNGAPSVPDEKPVLQKPGNFSVFPLSV